MQHRPELHHDAADPVELGERLAAARRAAGLTQRDMAARLGLTLWNLNRLETGSGALRQMPREAQGAINALLADQPARANGSNGTNGSPVNGSRTASGPPGAAAPPPELAPVRVRRPAMPPGPPAGARPASPPVAPPAASARPAPAALAPAAAPSPRMREPSAAPPRIGWWDPRRSALAVGAVAGALLLVVIAGVLAIRPDGERERTSGVASESQPLAAQVTEPPAEPAPPAEDPTAARLADARARVAALESQKAAEAAARRAERRRLRRERAAREPVAVPTTVATTAPMAAPAPTPQAPKPRKRPKPQQPRETSPEPDQPGRTPPATFTRP